MTARRAAKKKSAKKATRRVAKSATTAKRPTQRPASESAARSSTKRRAPKVPVFEHAPALLVDLVGRYVAAFNRGDLETVLALYHPKATMEDPVGYGPAQGRRAIGEVYAGGFRKGVMLEPDGAIRCTGRAVAFPVTARTSGATLQSINVFDVGPDGRIERMRAYWGPHNVVGSIAVRG
jgi:steroid delta-isomerase